MNLRHPLAVTTVVLLAPAASAQLLVTPFTESAVGVFATNGTKTGFNHKPAKALFPNTDRKIVAKAPGVSTGAEIHRVLSSRGLRVREYCYVAGSAARASAGGTTASTKVASLKQGLHSYMLNVRGNAKATLVVTMAGMVTGNGKVTVTVDIGNDKKVEFTKAANGRTLRQTFPISGGTPNPVLLTVDGSASWASSGSSYDMTVTCWVQKPVRQDCHFSRFGRPCDAVDLIGFDSPTTSNRHDMNLNVSGAPKSAPAILGLGIVQTQIQLTPCPLEILPILFLFHSTDASGNATINLKTNQKLNFTLFMQSVVADGNSATKVSNGLRMDCFDK